MQAQGKTFDVKNIVFTVSELLDRLNSNELVKGDVIIFDEVGVAANSRKWQSATNMALNYLVQTFRYLNLTVLFSCPSFDFIDIAVRKLFHGLLETMCLDARHNHCVAKFKNLQFNPVMGKLYYKYPVIYGKKCYTLRVGLASVQLRHAYEKMQKSYKNTLKVDIGDSISKKKTEEKKNNKEDEKIAEAELIEKVKKELKEKKLRPTIDNVYAVSGLTRDKARALKARLCAGIL